MPANARYRRRGHDHHELASKMIEQLKDGERFHILHGYQFVRVPGSYDVDLKNDLPSWGAAWEVHGERLLLEFIKRNPGRRPQAWHQFESNVLPDRGEEEEELEWLDRCNQVGDDERAAIVKKARELIAFNRGRNPEKPGSNFIPDMYGHVKYAVDHELLDEGEYPDFY